MNDFSINWIWVIGLISEFDFVVVDFAIGEEPSVAIRAVHNVHRDVGVDVLILGENRQVTAHYDDGERCRELEAVIKNYFANL
jgi:hypothetical protein